MAGFPRFKPFPIVWYLITTDFDYLQHYDNLRSNELNRETQFVISGKQQIPKNKHKRKHAAELSAAGLVSQIVIYRKLSRRTGSTIIKNRVDSIYAISLSIT